MPPVTQVRLSQTCRLIPSRYPSQGILDAVATPEDLPLMFELESWSNDRISAELGIIHRVPREEWVAGKPMASVVMAAFCHPRPGGGRFSGPDRGAWYAALSLETAHAEVIYHRTLELMEIGLPETRLEMCLYHADFDAGFHDVREPLAEYEPLHDPLSYTASQTFGRELLEAGSNGILYRSVRHQGGECLACFRPKLAGSVRAAGHFEYRWRGGRTPDIRKLP